MGLAGVETSKKFIILRLIDYLHGCIKMRFKGLDLNLLVAFESLVRTQSVAKSAAALNLSQPAMSASLRRLRTYFQDNLLVLEGKRLFPTPVAKALMPLVEQCLHDATVLIAASKTFDPATSQRTFRIAASDYTAVVLLSRVAQTLAEVAPTVRLDIMPPQSELRRQFQEGKLDLMIGPDDYALADLPSQFLFEEEYVVVGWSGNSLLSKEVSVRDMTSAGHVIATFGLDRAPAFADQQLIAMGIERKIEITTGSFLSVPWFLVGTNRLAIMHKRLALFLAETMALAMAKSPIPIPSARFVMQFPLAAREDHGIRWISEQIVGASNS
jgi:LysR family nod box-dependent transcriptional activator